MLGNEMSKGETLNFTFSADIYVITNFKFEN